MYLGRFFFSSKPYLIVKYLRRASSRHKGRVTELTYI